MVVDGGFLPYGQLTLSIWLYKIIACCFFPKLRNRSAVSQDSGNGFSMNGAIKFLVDLRCYLPRTINYIGHSGMRTSYEKLLCYRLVS